jgi:hypothetical protein
VAILKVAKSLAGLAWSSASQSVARRAACRAGPPPPLLENQKSAKDPPENAAYFSFRGGVAWGFAESNLWSGLGAD